MVRILALVIIMTQSVLVSCWFSSSSRLAHRSCTRTRLFLARAYTTQQPQNTRNHNTLPTRLLLSSSSSSSSSSSLALGFLQHPTRSSVVATRFMSSSSSSSTTTLQDEEQDLDAALDTILGDHAAKAKSTTVRLPTTTTTSPAEPTVSNNNNDNKQEQHMGQPMPKTLIEQVS